MRSGKVIDIRSFVEKRDQTRVRSTPLAILSVGRNPAILELRQKVIGSRSDLHILSLTPEQAEALAQSSEPHVWVFCHTVELHKVVSLACRIRRFSPQSKLILLEKSHQAGFEASLFHRIIHPIDGVVPFLEALTHLATAV